MNDRELLELAAKAAGIDGTWDEDPFDPEYSHNHKPAIRASGCPTWWWNPLNDDGDALRLAVKLKMNVWLYTTGAEVNIDDDPFNYAETNADDPCAASRRAIVRAAAAIAQQRGSGEGGGAGE